MKGTTPFEQRSGKAKGVLGRIGELFHDEEHRLALPLQLLIVSLVWFSIILMLVELNLEANSPYLSYIQACDRVILLVFVVEIILRIATFQPPQRAFYRDHALRRAIQGRVLYALRPMNIADILAVLAVVPALRGLRTLRLLRLLRSLQFFRYGSPVKGIERAFSDNSLLFGVAFSVLGVSVLLGGSTVYLLEREANPDIGSMLDGMWWALVTLTTVGFGDISPVTSLGRAVGSVLMISGMFTLALFAGIVGHTLLNSILSVQAEQFRMSGFVNHVVVCGYDPGIQMLLDSLKQSGTLVEHPVVIFSEQERPRDLDPEFIWVQGDPEKESELDKVRMNCAHAAILVGRRDMTPQQADARTLLTAFTVRSYLRRYPAPGERRAPLYVIGEILDAENVQHAQAAGCDEVIESTRLGFSLIAHAVSMPGTATVLSRVASLGENSVYKGPLPAEELGGPFVEVARRLKERFNILAIGFVDDEGTPQVNPGAQERVTRHNEVLYLAETRQL